MVIIKNQEQIEGIRKSCRLLSQIMLELGRLIEPGQTTKQLNTVAENLISKAGGRPAFKGYPGTAGIRPFPTALCTSINSVVVHGPAVSSVPLKEGDIIGIDCGIDLNGFYSDMAITFPVGTITEKAKHLLQTAERSLYKGIEQIKPGNKILDISKAIEDTIKPHNFGIIKDFVGHGVGLQAHEDPRIPNFVNDSLKRDLQIELQAGMVLAIEPMITAGSETVEILEDGWSAVTVDDSLSAHFEHTVAVTEQGYDILTKL